MLYIAGTSISLFLCLLLLMKKQSTPSDKVLLVWLVALTLHLALMRNSADTWWVDHPNLFAVLLPFPLLHGMLLFLYARTVISERLPGRRVVLLHLIPVGLLVLLALPFYLLPAAEKQAVIEHDGAGFEWYMVIRTVLMFTSGIGYSVWTLFLIRRHRVRQEQLFSNTDKQNLRWLEYLSIGLGAVWLFAFSFNDEVIFSGVMMFVLFIGFYGIQRVPVFHSAATTTQTVPELEQTRYAKSGLKDEDIDRVYAQLNQLMQEQKPYTNPELNLAELAGMLNLHPNYLSQVINDRETQNFYQYINTLRVKEFLRVSVLPENRRFTLLALAFDCGFNSKSTFNKYFKQYTGKTPSDFFEHANY